MLDKNLLQKCESLLGIECYRRVLTTVEAQFLQIAVDGKLNLIGEKAINEIVKNIENKIKKQELV